MPNLNLTDIINVIVNLSPVSTIAAGFNIGLIVGKSTVISAATRTKIYASAAEMIEDGFAITDPEYKAAVIYFSQSPKPTKLVVGRWDGTGAETAAEAIAACRTSDKTWYACMICGAAKADILAVAPIIEAATPSSVFMYDTADTDVPAGTAGNVMLTLEAAGYSKTIGQYSEQEDSIAAILGYAMGASSKAKNSAYTLAYKTEVGVTPDDLSTAQITEIKGANGNVYINRGQSYKVFEPGVMTNGQHFDEILGIDALVNDIQESVMIALTTTPKVPQTDEGVSYLINVISGACSRARNRGFLAPGVWNAPTILNLETGDTLANGFAILADTIANQSAEDIANRISPTIYVPIKLAGAIEHVVINILVNR